MFSLQRRAVYTGFCLLVFGLSAGLSQSIVEVIPLPSTTYWNQAYGLATDGTHLFVNSGTTSSVYNIGYIYTLDTNASRLDSLPTGLGSSQGLAYDGTNYWYFYRGTSTTSKFYKISPAGAFLDSIPAGTTYVGGLGWDGTGLWYSLYYPDTSAALFKIDVSSHTIVDTLVTLGTQPQGIAWDGTYLYYAMDNNDGDPEKIYQVDLSTGDTVKSWFLPEGPSSNMSPRGLAWDGAYLWMIAEPVGGASGRVLYKYDLGGSGTPDINLPVSLLDFGEVRIGQSLTLNLQIQNVGTAALQVDSVRITLSSQFSSTFTTPVSIDPNASVLYPMTFTPTVYGMDSAFVYIYSDDPDEGTKTFSARATGIYADAYLQVAASHDFGLRRAGTSNLWRMIVQNTGGDQLSISSVSVTGSTFRIDSVTYPVLLDSLQTQSFKVWFEPTSGSSYLDTIRLTSNASNGPVTDVIVLGSGDETSPTIGVPFWTYTVPNHPISNTFRLVKAVRAMNDITGDGKPDMIVSTENYWTMAVNGNASGTTDSLWAFTTYISSFSAGSIGTTGDYSHQKALAIASDLNGDGYNDVVIGTGGGNEHVYALNGRTGQMLWSFGTDHPDSFGLGDFTGVDVSTDFNNDNVPDVVAAAAATQSGGVGGRRSIYLFDGTNGNMMWQSALPGFTHGVASVDDISGDGIPDAVGAVGEPAYKLSAFSGTNGNILWDFPVPSSTGGGKEVMSYPVAGQSSDLILGAFWGPVYRVDGESGTEVWSVSTGGAGVMQMKRLRDVTGDGIDEVIVALLTSGAKCINGATGTEVWFLPLGNTMGLSVIPDLNQDGYDEVVLAVQNQAALIVRGQDGQQLGLYSGFGSNQTREVSTVPDMDGNNSQEIIAGSNQGNVALISGGIDAGPNSVKPVELPAGYSLSQNYPNPFNPSTTIEFGIPVAGKVKLTVCDILGREVRAFDYTNVPAGVHQIVWDGKNGSGGVVSSGVYFYTMKAGDHTLTKRMMVLK